MEVEFIIKLLELLTSVISVISAIVAVIYSMKSKEKVRQSEQMKREMESIYNQYLQNMSNAAQSITQIQKHRIEEANYQQLYLLIKKSIANLPKDCFAIEDIEKHLEETSCVRVHRSDIIKIMHALVEYGLIKELSPNIYHRFTL
ncbi:hypothetical protein E0L15_07660 [Pseudoflavonifractor sp. SW1122]|uniref:hypothetical protein n=1 Tax=Pseudoflavonifractor sp. SW1122 TaxID=2530044 RepID=UPI00143AFC53|nr:hypothetical protein [Pseudoflavonifractor sp. SW1122]NJE74473.1 hypothetical protein [Pseudoflavonifractor sp. SW1122]